LSRACLGKKMTFSTKWRKNGVFLTRLCCPCGRRGRHSDADPCLGFVSQRTWHCRSHRLKRTRGSSTSSSQAVRVWTRAGLLRRRAVCTPSARLRCRGRTAHRCLPFGRHGRPPPRVPIRLQQERQSCLAAPRIAAAAPPTKTSNTLLQMPLRQRGSPGLQSFTHAALAYPVPFQGIILPACAPPARSHDGVFSMICNEPECAPIGIVSVW